MMVLGRTIEPTATGKTFKKTGDVHEGITSRIKGKVGGCTYGLMETSM